MEEDDFKFLLDRYSRGDRSALGDLVEREEEGLRRWLAKKMPAQLLRRVGISDIIQQTSIELLTIQKRFENRGIGSFRKLLRGIAAKMLANTIDREYARKRSLSRHDQPRPPSVSSLPSPAKTPSQILAGKETAAAVRDCYSRLSDPDREILRLVDYEGIAYDEIARDLGISPVAVRKRYSRASARLRELFRWAGLAEN